MLIVGGEGGSKILWIYTYPLIAFFLFGKKEGLFWSVVIFILALVLLFIPFDFVTVYPYFKEFKTHFLATYMLVSTIAYLFEHFRAKYKSEIEEQNKTLTREKGQLRQEMEIREQLEKELKLLANTDPLTGALNRRSFWSVANREINRHKRHHHTLALFVIDIDHFKQINDTHGHLMGDLVIKKVVRTSIAVLREADVVARIGGEEFCILLTETNADDVVNIANRLREKLAAPSIEIEDFYIKFTVSIGITILKEHDTTLENLLLRADEALYDAKRNGRNQVKMIL